MTCPRCKVGRPVEIGFTVGGRKVTMHSCSRCASRWWDSEGSDLALPGVLELAAARRRAPQPVATASSPA